MATIEEKGDYILIHVRVQPKASRNLLRMDPEGRIRVALTAPPIKGAANKALCAFLAKLLGLPKSAVHLTAGAKSRDKTVRVEGMSAQEVMAGMARTR